MTKALNTRLIYLFVGVLAISFLGFYKTYLVKFPDFEGFTTAHHFHGLMALIWLLMLVLQPVLIRAKKYQLHRQIGKLGYIIMPLLVISLFLVSKATYFKNIKTMPEADALAILPNGTLEIFAFSTLFVLAMVYKKNTAYHLRFMASTGLMMLGPGLGRFLITTFGIPFPVVLLFIILSTTGVGLVWMILDIRNKKSAFPMSVFIVFGLLTGFINANSHSAWWQGFGKWWVNTLF